MARSAACRRWTSPPVRPSPCPPSPTPRCVGPPAAPCRDLRITWPALRGALRSGCWCWHMPPAAPARRHQPTTCRLPCSCLLLPAGRAGEEGHVQGVYDSSVPAANLGSVSAGAVAQAALRGPTRLARRAAARLPLAAANSAAPSTPSPHHQPPPLVSPFLITPILLPSPPASPRPCRTPLTSTTASTTPPT